MSNINGWNTINSWCSKTDVEKLNLIVNDTVSKIEHNIHSTKQLIKQI